LYVVYERPKPKGNSNFEGSYAVIMSVPDEDALGVLDFRPAIDDLSGEVAVRRHVLEGFRKRHGQSPARVNFAEQDVSDSVPRLLAREPGLYDGGDVV